MDFVLWTDPDVLFRQDITSCSLAQPRLLSIGPEVCFPACFVCKLAHVVLSCIYWPASEPVHGAVWWLCSSALAP